MVSNEIHKYIIRTNGEMVLKNIQLNNSTLSIAEVGDYAGEEGRWVQVGHRRWRCSHCGSIVAGKTPKYCDSCGSRNEKNWESPRYV